MAHVPFRIRVSKKTPLPRHLSKLVDPGPIFSKKKSPSCVRFPVEIRDFETSLTRSLTGRNTEEVKRVDHRDFDRRYDVMTRGKEGGRGRGRMARSHPWERLFNFTKNAGSISLNGSDILTLCARQAWATGCLIKLGRLNYGALSSQRPLFYSRLSFIRGRLSTRRSFKNFFRRFFFLSFFSSLDSMIHTGWAFYFLM